MAENLSITHLKTFLMVADLSSFRKTAEVLQTTQPAISSRIAKLEDILNTRLFNRSTGHIHMTEAGLALKPHAEHIIRISGSLSEYIRDSNLAVGEAKVGVTEFAVETWIPSFLENIETVFPNLVIELYVDKSRELKRRLLEKELDVAFMLGPVNDERIYGQKVATHDYGWFVAPGKGLLKRNIYSIREITDNYSIITDMPYSMVQQEIRGFLQAIEIYDPKIISSFSFHSAVELSTIGIGVACIPKRLAKPAVDAGKLIPLMTEWTPSSMHFSGSFLKGNETALAKRLVHFVKSLL